MDVSSSSGLHARPVTLPADLADYARIRHPLVARICVGPGLDQWEYREVERAMTIKASKIGELKGIDSNSQEKALAQRTVRETLWGVCDLILLVRSASLEPEEFDLAAPISQAELRAMFPLVGEWLYGHFSEGRIDRMRRALRICCEDQIRRDRRYAEHLDRAGLLRLQEAHSRSAMALLWTCAAIAHG